MGGIGLPWSQRVHTKILRLGKWWNCNISYERKYIYIPFRVVFLALKWRIFIRPLDSIVLWKKEKDRMFLSQNKGSTCIHVLNLCVDYVSNLTMSLISLCKEREDYVSNLHH